MKIQNLHTQQNHCTSQLLIITDIGHVASGERYGVTEMPHLDYILQYPLYVAGPGLEILHT